MENEMGDDEPESDEEDLDDTEKPVYNPKKVPLDWTGTRDERVPLNPKPHALNPNPKPLNPKY